MEKRRLTPEEWAAAKLRWESDPRPGFDWLATEIRATTQVDISRQAVAKMAGSKGWSKGTAPGKAVAGKVAKKVAQPATKTAPQLSLVAQPKIKEPKAPPERKPYKFESKPAHVLVNEQRAAVREGRPVEYKPEFCHAVTSLCHLRATSPEIADFFHVDERTIYRWREDHPDFCRAMDDGRTHADATVASSLYMRATGYTAIKNRPMSVSTGIGTSEIQIVPFEEYVAPDPTAIRYWLNNRRPAEWRDKVILQPEVPNDLPSVEMLDAIYARKMAEAQRVQELVSGRMMRLGIVAGVVVPDADLGEFGTAPGEDEDDIEVMED